GTGIPPDLRRRIFEPFFTTKETGTGLGLSIVSGIISSYGGTIEVEAEPGRGTTFTIRLPITSDSPTNAVRPAGYITPGGVAAPGGIPPRVVARGEPARPMGTS